MTAIFTLDTVLDHVQGCARKVGEDFTKPDDDWRAILLLYADQVGVVDFQNVMRTQESKAQLPALLERLFCEYKPRIVASVVSCYVRRMESNDPMAQLTVEMNLALGTRNDPLRVEELVVSVCDGEKVEQRFATITRHKDKPPTLGDFAPDVAAQWFGDDMPPLLLQAFKKTSKRRAR